MDKRIDMHMHVGLRGDEWPHLGHMSDWYRRQLVYKTFLLYGRLKPRLVSDRKLREVSIKVIDSSGLDHVVCLALDPVYDNNGARSEAASHLWVDNEYVIELRDNGSQKILLGASVHPYDPRFKDRVQEYVGKGAVLLKWLPSAQQFNLADDRVREALEFIATAKNGKPLPLLLHVGAEYAIPSTNPRTASYDFLSWSWMDKVGNFFRGKKKKWYRPDTAKIDQNLKKGLDAGAIIMFAHCGLPYIAPKFLKFLEHSDFKRVRKYLQDYPVSGANVGKCYADISACATPFRRSYFKSIRKLPPESLLFGSDFPTPVFELSADLAENWKDFKAILKGDLDRIIVPQDNLLDVNFRELSLAFPGHPMFTNFNGLL